MNRGDLLRYCFPAIVLVVFLFLFGAGSLTAGDAAYEIANGLFDTGNYEEAITEYKRFICFNPDHEMCSDAYFRIGLAYRNQERWWEAVDAMRKAMAITADDSLRDERRISTAIILIASGDYSAAEFELLRVAHFSDNSFLKKKAFFFLGVRYLYAFRWEESRKAFEHYFSDSLSPEADELDSLFSLSTGLVYKSPGVAKWLSTFLPGSGQIYCGEWRSGINALAINSLTAYLLIDALLDHRLQDVIIGHVTLFDRYYRGNRSNAEKAASSRNERLRRAFAKDILGRLQQMESVPK